jgi:hypothetical protein
MVVNAEIKQGIVNLLLPDEKRNTQKVEIKVEKNWDYRPGHAIGGYFSFTEIICVLDALGSQ